MRNYLIFSLITAVLILCGSWLQTNEKSETKKEVTKTSETEKVADKKDSETKKEVADKVKTKSDLTDDEVFELYKKKKKKKKPKTPSQVITEMIFGIVGGLGIFLLGMHHMSHSIQTIAGSGLRNLIKKVTDNRIMACIVGVAVTVLVQSSSVTTVMVVGFVNSGIMQLNQAIGVILGANIGTTITGWVLVLKVGKWGLPMIGVASFVYLFFSNQRETLRYVALAIIGIGMVFLGLELMKNGFKPMKDFKEFIISSMNS